MNDTPHEPKSPNDNLDSGNDFDFDIERLLLFDKSEVLWENSGDSN
jgi:hypothetical protein